MNYLISCGLALLLLLSQVGCQTNELKQYEKLKVGMDKGEVLEIMGSPRRCERRQSQDRWTYVFYQNQMEHQKEIQFFEGRANYIGSLRMPEISAHQRDQSNEASNLEIEALWAKQRAESRSQTEKLTGAEPSSPQILYVPKFEPIH